LSRNIREGQNKIESFPSV